MESRPVPAKGTPEGLLRTLETCAHAPPPPRLPAGTVFRDRYRVTGMIGVGPIAVIYRAEEMATGRPVKVKIWHEVGDGDRSRVEKFQRPATSGGAALSQLPPSFVAVRDCGLTADGQLFLVTELVDGPSIRELVEMAPGLEPGRALALARRIGEALATALDRGFPALRITPADIVVDAEDSVKILGSEALVLRRLGLGDSLAEAPRPDPQYAAPEELAGEPATDRSAVYCFGLLIRFLLQETLAGERRMSAGPFKRLLLSLRLRGQQPSVSSALDQLTTRMTDPDPAARPTLLTVLNELWRASYLEAAEPGRPTAPPHPWVLAAVLVLLVAGALIAWLAISSGWPGPSTRLPAARPSPVTAPDATPVLPAPPPPPESAPPLAPPPATVIAPPPATRALPIPRLPPKPAPPPLRPPPATVIAPPPATRALPIPPPPPKPSPPLTLPPATVIAPPPATPAAPIPAPPAAVEGAAAPTVVDPVPSTAARRVQPTQPRTGNQQTDPGAIIDWLLRQKSRDDQ